MIFYGSLIQAFDEKMIEWFLNRIKAGFFDKKISMKECNRYFFSAENIEKIFFIGHKFKNNKTLFNKIEQVIPIQKIEFVQEFSYYSTYFAPQETIDINKSRLYYLEKLSASMGKRHTSISYGPIYISDLRSIEYHKQMLHMLSDFTSQYICTIYLDFFPNLQYATSKYPARFCTKEEKQTITDISLSFFRKYNVEVKIKPNIQQLSEKEMDLGMHNLCPYKCRICPGITNLAMVDKRLHCFLPTTTCLLGNTNERKDKIHKLQLQ